MWNYFFEPLKFELSIFSFQFSFGRSVSAYSSAVGLSALSLLAPLSLRIAKDAAAIPNAEELPTLSSEPIDNGKDTQKKWTRLLASISYFHT